MPDLDTNRTPEGAGTTTTTTTSVVVPRLRTAALALLSVEFLVLLVTGVALVFLYRPSSTAGLSDLFEASALDSAAIERADRLRSAHRVTSIVAIPTAVVAAVTWAIGRAVSARRRLDLVRSAALGAVVPLAAATGYLLPWDQLALPTITTSTDLDGFDALWENDVLFVVVGTTEVEPGTILAWLAVHLVLSAALLVLVASAWWTRRRRRI